MRSHDKVLVALAFILIQLPIACTREDIGVAGDLYYKIETGGVLAGYAVVDTSLVVENGEELIRLDQSIHFESKLLGSDVTTDARMSFVLEPDGKRVRRHEGESSSGTTAVNWSYEFTDSQARGSSSLKQDNMVMDLPPDAIVENTVFFEHVVADFTGTELEEKTYRVLDMVDFEVRDTRYEKHAQETLELPGGEFDVVVVDRSVEATGTLVRLWIDTGTAMVVKSLEQDGNVVTLADASVVKNVERVDMDEYIMEKTDVAIADVAGITYMKVRARIRPIGLQPTPETLNVPGQKFTGTCENNVIEGVFEIEHQRYDGAGAPAFPIAEPPSQMEEYLVADGVFETDDEVLAEKAREITAGAANAWEAATRLSEWVADEIGYAIPGGVTARNTYNIRAGECGAHSILLATFCRAVGIPARMVWGCMYTPNNGGAFGQHGWTEVHMGTAGWIPVDATADEADFVDSGHIRLADFTSLVLRLNAQEFEILDYRVAGAGVESTITAQERYAPYLGSYRHKDSPAEYEVKIMDGGLVVDIPDRVMLAVDDPDPEGRWVCKMATHVFVTFDRAGKDESGNVETLTIHEVYSLPRQEEQDTNDADVPPDLEPYPGRYRMAALSSDFEVICKNNRLLLKHPRIGGTMELEPAGEDDVWRTRNGMFTISFVTGEDGDVVSMTLDAANEFRKR